MLIILDVQEHKRTFKSLFRPYIISAQKRTSNRISVLYIHYHLYRGKINFPKLYALTADGPKTILCNQNLSLQNTLFKRFESDTLKIKMMQNFVTAVLHKIKNPFHIGYIDRKAEYPQFLHQLINNASNLTIVSTMPRFYENICQKISHKKINVSNSFDSLKNCDIIISPSLIEENFENHAVIFTYSKPTVNLSNLVLFDYHFPAIFSEIKPDCVSREYFLSALYSIEKITELENITPKTCSDGIQSYSMDYIAAIYNHRSPGG